MLFLAAFSSKIWFFLFRVTRKFFQHLGLILSVKHSPRHKKLSEQKVSVVKQSTSLQVDGYLSFNSRLLKYQNNEERYIFFNGTRWVTCHSLHRRKWNRCRRATRWLTYSYSLEIFYHCSVLHKRYISFCAALFPLFPVISNLFIYGTFSTFII